MARATESVARAAGLGGVLMMFPEGSNCGLLRFRCPELYEGLVKPSDNLYDFFTDPGGGGG